MQEASMSRFLLTWKDVLNETQMQFVDSLAINAGPDPEPDVLVARFEEESMRHRYWLTRPVCVYHTTMPTDPKCDYVVYREADTRVLFYAGAVHCEEVRPAEMIEDWISWTKEAQAE